MVRRGKSKKSPVTSSLMVQVESAHHQVISLTPAEQLAFWQALQKNRRLTSSQRHLGRLMTGDE